MSTHGTPIHMAPHECSQTFQPLDIPFQSLVGEFHEIFGLVRRINNEPIKKHRDHIIWSMYGYQPFIRICGNQPTTRPTAVCSELRNGHESIQNKHVMCLVCGTAAGQLRLLLLASCPTDLFIISSAHVSLSSAVLLYFC